VKNIKPSILISIFLVAIVFSMNLLAKPPMAIPKRDLPGQYEIISIDNEPLGELIISDMLFYKINLHILTGEEHVCSGVYTFYQGYMSGMANCDDLGGHRAFHRFDLTGTNMQNIYSGERSFLWSSKYDRFWEIILKRKDTEPLKDTAAPSI
jgi:hypothetical protein